MEWLRQNGFFLLVLVAFAAMHMFGHGGHGAHGGHGGHDKPDDRAAPRGDEPARSGDAVLGGTKRPNARPPSPHDHGAAT